MIIRLNLAPLVLHLTLAVPLPTCGATARDSIESLTPDSLLDRPNVEWRPSELAPAIRSRVHLTTAQVPPFPSENPKLSDPRNWPAVANIGGVACSLRVSTGSYDAIWMVDSLEEVKPGASFALFYTSVPGDRWKPRRGPSYYWRGDGSLTDRYWTGGDSISIETSNYSYYPSGKLFSFDYRSGFNLGTGSENQSEWFNEVFGRGGSLIGCALGSGGWSRKSLFVGYWMGKEVGYREYQDRRHDAQMRALR